MIRIFLLLMLFPFVGYSQNSEGKNLMIYNATQQIGKKGDSKFTLIGNVKLEIDNNKIGCDSVIVDIKNKTLNAYGNVTIFRYQGLKFNSSYTEIELPNILRIAYFDKNMPKVN